MFFWRIRDRYRDGGDDDDDVHVVDRFSRGAIARRELVPVTDIYRVRSRHNFERGSTKKIDGKDFTASYHSNTKESRDGEGNDRVEIENEGKKLRSLKIRDVRHTSCKGAFASFYNFMRFIVDICIMMKKIKYHNYIDVDIWQYSRVSLILILRDVMPKL